MFFKGRYIIMKKFAIFLIRIYQKTLSPILGNNCKFVPSCSEYTIQAIEEYGFLKGSFMGINRICRCSPLTRGGFDPVPKEK